MTRSPQPVSLVQVAEQLRRGDLTPVELVQRCLGQIDAWEPEIHAWVHVDRDGALQQAEQLQRQQAEPRQPLWGIPVGIKDIIDVAGLPTLCGATWKLEPPPAQQDALVVARLRQSGAIILGKTVTTAWACFDPPPTRNPWNLAHTPGGSSSGSAAAVATGMCVAALGTQTGGSILRPASFCGVSGLKPAHRSEFLAGVALVSPALDHVGPIAATAADLQIMWQGLAESCDAGPASATTAVSVLDDPFLEQADAPVRQAFQTAIAKLGERFGIERYSLPASFTDIHRWHGIIMAYEAAQVHRIRFTTAPETYPPTVAGLIENGLKITDAVYADALSRQWQLSSEVRRHLLQNTVLAMPTTLTAAPACETTGDPRFNSPWSFLGLPAMTIPCGNSAGLPLGLQLIGLQENSLLAAAVLLESQLVTGG